MSSSSSVIGLGVMKCLLAARVLFLGAAYGSGYVTVWTGSSGQVHSVRFLFVGFLFSISHIIFIALRLTAVDLEPIPLKNCRQPLHHQPAQQPGSYELLNTYCQCEHEPCYQEVEAPTYTPTPSPQRCGHSPSSWHPKCRLGNYFHAFQTSS